MDLREALLSYDKPRNQFHDGRSLSWLYENRPEYLLKNYNIEPDAVQTIDKITPWKKINTEWFTNELTKNGIHGFRHVSRVSIYSILLSLFYKKNISMDELEAISFAAILHDCRRKNDNADTRHGVRSAEWLKNNPHILPKNISAFLPAISFAMSVHNDTYENINKKNSYKKFKFFVDVLKTADAMDRYRFPRSDWWMSDYFIVLQPHKKHLSFAFDITFLSEKLFSESQDNFFSIENALEQLR